MCGDDVNQAEADPPAPSRPPPPPPPPAWSVPVQWGQRPRVPFSPKHQAGTSGESSFFKRCIPFVSLTLSKSGKSIAVGPPEENVFVKIAESALSVNTILTEVAKKISMTPGELVLLDSSCLMVSDDNGQFELHMIINIVNLVVLFYNRDGLLANTVKTCVCSQNF